MPRIHGQRLMKYVDQAVSYTAAATFNTIQFFNKRIKPRPSFIPKWSDKPLQKSWERSKPPLGWPRQTDSLCPTCVKEARAEILRGDADWTKLLSDKPGEIKATIILKDGRVVMEKRCPKHGYFED